MLIRSPLRKDLPDFVRIEKACHPGSPMAREAIVRHIGREQTRCFVAEEGTGNVVGCLLLDYASGEEAIVSRLNVDPDYTHTACARRLLASAKRFNDERLGRPCLTTYVSGDDRPSQELFKTLGFTSRLEKDGDTIRFWIAS